MKLDHSQQNAILTHMEQGNTKNNTNTSSRLLLIAIIFMACVVVGTAFYHLVEKYSYIDSIYFTAMTLTTVGYGDFAPQTDAGKIFTAMYAFVGVGTFLGFAATLFEAIVHRHYKHLHKHLLKNKD